MRAPATMKLNADQGRALRLLDEAGPRGTPEVLMEMAHGFKSEVLAGLVRDGLASVAPESMRAGGRAITVARLRITDAGRRALTGSA
jgi:hypothetical protein